jgi:hypothetical protein
VGRAQQSAEPPDRADCVLCARIPYRRCAWVRQENAENPIGGYRACAETDEGDEGKSNKNPHWGSTLDDFLNEEGVREAARFGAVTRVVAWQLGQEMKKQGMSKTRMAELMNTIRAQVDRILTARGNVTIESLQRAASLLGRELRLELV